MNKDIIIKVISKKSFQKNDPKNDKINNPKNDPKNNKKKCENKCKNKNDKIKQAKKDAIMKSIKVKKIDMNQFCDGNNKLFNKINIFLNNPKNIIILMNMLKVFSHPKAQEPILQEIKNNKDKIHKILKNFNIIMDYYKSNNLVLKSDVGHFILYYEYNLSKLKTKNDKDYLIFFHKLLNYPKLISLLKEIFYILSDYRSCIYFMTPNIKFRNSDYETVNDFVSKFYNNQKMCFSIISGYYPTDKSPWGTFYTGAYSCFESLIILKKYYKDPLKTLKIEFKHKKINNKTQILKKMSEMYNIKLKKLEKVMNITNYIIFMKNLKYSMHEVIDSIFDMIYEKSSFKNIQKCYIVNGVKIFNQKKNYELGVKIYILVSNNYISNVNCFENFTY